MGVYRIGWDEMVLVRVGRLLSGVADAPDIIIDMVCLLIG
jgi:hypothetical protein